MTTIAPSGPVSLGSVRGLFDAAGNLDLSAGAIFRNGNVGIGTTFPQHRLHVWSDTTPSSGVGGNLQFTNPTGGYGGLVISHSYSYGIQDILNASDNLLTCIQEGETVFTVAKGTGNVGIGTNNPLVRLDISGRAIIRKSENLVAVADCGLLIAHDGRVDKNEFDASGHSLVVASDTNITNNRMLLIIDADDFNNCCGLQSARNGQSVRSLVLNAQGGNVGIGTTITSANLHVNGNAAFHSIELISPSGINGNTYIDFGYNGRDFAGRILYDNCGNYMLFCTTDPQSGFAPERMRILGNGNVGIGTTDPQRTMVVQKTDSRGELAVVTRNTATSNGAGFMISTTTSNSAPRTEFYYNQTGLNGADASWAGTPAMTILSANGNVGIGTTNPSQRLHVEGSIFITGSYLPSSDDRLKLEESHIEEALPTILKLRPQLYRKVPGLEDSSGGFIESGLIAQEVYYDAPELRHLVSIPEDASGIEVPPPGYGESSDPNVDPDYSNWGSTPAALNYIGLIPYLIRGMQEQEAKLTAQQQRIAALEAQLSAGSA